MSRKTQLACLALGLVACNAIAGLDGDFTVGDAGANAPSSEAGASSSTSSSGMGTSSSSSSSSSSGSSTSSSSSSGTIPDDAGADVTTDSGVDSGPDVDAPPLSFCQTKTEASRLFCSDFTNQPNAAEWGWSSHLTTGVGALIAVAGTLGTADRHLHAVGPSGPNNSGNGAILFQELTTLSGGTDLLDKHTLTMTFDFTVLSSDSYAVVGGFQIGPIGNASEYGLSVVGCSGGKTCARDSDSTFKAASGTLQPIALNAPHKGTVTLTRVGSKIGGSIKVDNQMILDQPTGGAEPGAPIGPVRILVGAAFAGTGTGTTSTTIDNVLVDETVTP